MNKINLTGVPETMLWPLYNRGCEQKRTDRLINDPLSLEIMNMIDYDYGKNFGKPTSGHPLRARVFDDAIRQWLVSHPDGIVISLGEGLDTQFWRVDNGLLTWFSIDIPEAIEVRNRFVPSNDRIRVISCSALDFKWIEHIPQGKPVFIVLSGVIMYFTESDAKMLLTRIGDRFSGSEIVFDMIPGWYSQKTMKGMSVTKFYKAPPMPWGLNYGKSADILKIHPSFRIKQRFTFVDPFPERMRPFSYFRQIKWITNRFSPWMIHLRIEK